MYKRQVQDALNQKNIRFEYTEEDGCGSLDFMFRGLKFHVWEYHDGVWGSVERTCAVVDIPPRVLHLPVSVELVVGEYVVERNLVAELRALQV